MTEPERARLFHLVRPQRLFIALREHPTFVLPMLVLTVCVTVYTQVAIGPALPRVIPTLLERSVVPESELVRMFRSAILGLSLLTPIFVAGVTGFACWMLGRILGIRPGFVPVIALVSWSFLWVALSFLVKTALVKITGLAEPATNLALFVTPRHPLERLLFAFTNPFLILAGLWTVRGLATWSGRSRAAWLAGGIPWVAWIAALALTGGQGTRLAPRAPVSFDDWSVIRESTLVLRAPPGHEPEARELAAILDDFTRKLATEFGLEPRPLRIYAFAEHRNLERATGEFLHVKVIGSIRGQDVLYVELPGRSAAFVRERGVREAMRYTALMHLAPALGGAPRWFVEGLAHAAIFPYSRELEREYRETIRRTGVPNWNALHEHRLFQTPEGPVLARGVVDWIAATHGPEVLKQIRSDVTAGTSFRDALYAHTRLTTSALESGWLQSVARIVEGSAGGVPAETAPPAKTTTDAGADAPAPSPDSP